MIRLILLLGICSLYIGCSSIHTEQTIINPHAPIGSTQTITVTKINPVFYSGETIILATDKNNKETHYETHHTDIGMMDSAFVAIMGFLMGKL